MGFDNEIVKTIEIAISSITLALALTFSANLISTRNDMASIMNDDRQSRKQVQQYNNYNMYSQKTITGEEAIACIRSYYDQGVSVYVGSNAVSLHLYNLDTYATNSADFDITPNSKLVKAFGQGKKFRAYVVYNAENVTTKYTNMINKYNASKTGTNKGVTLLDTFDKAASANSEVTGLILVDIDLL